MGYPTFGWSALWLATVIAFQLSRVPGESRHEVDEYICAMGVLAWATSCSGTECPAWVCEGLSEKLGISNMWEHMCSAEIVAFRRRWMRTVMQLLD